MVTAVFWAHKLLSSVEQKHVRLLLFGILVRCFGLGRCVQIQLLFGILVRWFSYIRGELWGRNTCLNILDLAIEWLITWSFDFCDAIYSLAIDFCSLHFSKCVLVFWYAFVQRSKEQRLRRDHNRIGRLLIKQYKKEKYGKGTISNRIDCAFGRLKNFGTWKRQVSVWFKTYKSCL